MSDYIIGIDISKQHLDLHRLPDEATRRVSNSPTGLRELMNWIGKHTVKRIVFEATGHYHRTLEQTLGKAGLVRPCARLIRARPCSCLLWSPAGIIQI